MIDLHYWTTPNGHKITMFLEESALPYRIIPVNISKGDQFKPEFLAISPNNRIPAIVDHSPKDGGKPISVFESGAILLYLAEKTGMFLPMTLAGRSRSRSGCSGRWVVWDRWPARTIISASTHLKSFPTLSIATSTRRTASMVCSTNGLSTTHSWRANIQLPTWLRTRGSCPGNVKDRTWTISAISSAGSRRFRARPATMRAYDRADQINTQPTVSAESKSVLFGQTAATAAG